MVEIQKTIDKWLGQKTVDEWFGKVQKEVASKIGNFVAFMFFLIALGAWIGMSVAHNYPHESILAILIPAAAGIIAYYNRTFATAVFVIILAMVFFI